MGARPSVAFWFASIQVRGRCAAVESQAVESWTRVIKKLRRIRFQQRLWAALGQHLQTLSPAIRDMVRKLERDGGMDRLLQC